MAEPITVIFVEKQTMKSGVSAAGVPWTKYQYLGQDNEHYELFDDLELNKEVKLVKQVSDKVNPKSGKAYENWVVYKDFGGTGKNSRNTALLEEILRKINTLLMNEGLSVN